MLEDTDVSNHSVPRGVMLAYGSVAFPLAAAFIALQVIVPTFYAESTSMSLSVIGFVLLVARLCDMATDPIVGYLSDRSSSRFGRRKLFVVAAVLPMVVSIWALFNPPASAGAVYLLLWTLAIYLAGTVLIVPLWAWGAELTPDYHQKARVTGVRVAFGLAGTIAALLVPVWVGTDSGQGLGGTLTVIAILAISTLLLSTAWAALRVPDISTTVLPENTVAAVRELLCRANPFRQLLVSFLFNAVGNAIPGTLFLLYVTHVLASDEHAGALLFLYFICAAASVPFWVWLSQRFGKHQTWSMAILLACAFFVWTPWLSPDTLWVFVIIVAVTGFATGADLALPAAINGDIIEWDAVQSGYRRPGLFFALWGTATKLSYALAIGIAFPLLDVFGFDANGGNSADSLSALAFMYGIPCLGFKLCALWLMRGYPITEAEHARIRKILEQSESNQS